MKAKGNRKNVALSINQMSKLKESIDQLNQIKEIIAEPDPHGEKHKQKIYKIKEILHV